MGTLPPFFSAQKFKIICQRGIEEELQSFVFKYLEESTFYLNVDKYAVFLPLLRGQMTTSLQICCHLLFLPYYRCEMLSMEEDWSCLSSQ